MNRRIRNAASLVIAASLLTTLSGPAVALEPGADAPDFILTDLDGAEHRLADYVADGKTVVLEWFNPDCPFVKKHHKHNQTMAETRAENEDVIWLAINSGGKGKEGHGLKRNRKAVKDYGISYPILIDESGEVGRTYGAKTSPHMFVIAGGKVAYEGAIDDNRSPKKLGKRNHVAAALNELGDGEEVSVNRTRPYGCSVKYGANPKATAGA